MRISLIYLAAALTLGACAQLQTDIQTGIAAACTDVIAAQKANPNSPVAPWASACSPTGMAGLAQNSATIQWLGGIAAQLSAPAVPAPAVKAS